MTTDQTARAIRQAEHEIRTVALVEWGWPSGPRHDALVRWAGAAREAADLLTTLHARVAELETAREISNRTIDQMGEALSEMSDD